jgi:DNA-binding LytR/AlgR family response regulator
MKIRIAIVDDMSTDRSLLRKCIDSFFGEHKSDSVSIEEFVSAEDFLPKFSAGMFELVFLDICMDEMNGIELAKELRAADPHLMIVFQTTAREYAFDAFPIHPFDYLIKPCRQDEVDAVLEEALRVLDAGDPEISVSAGRTTYNVPLRSIVAIASQGHNTEICLTNKQNLSCTETFKGISSKLGDDPRFLMINRGIIVNMDHVLAPSADSMQMKDGSSYPIKVNGRAAVLSSFSQYMISKVDKRG